MVEQSNNAMKRTAQTWTCSASLARKYKEELKLKFPYIQNGVNVSNFIHPSEEQKEKMREKLNLPKDKVILVYSGQFVARKDQKFLLELFSEEKSLENYLLLLLGDGADYAELKEEYGKKQNVVMTGSVNNVNEYLQASDIYIASSKSEGLPNGVLEAMAVGLPVILSDSPLCLSNIPKSNIIYLQKKENGTKVDISEHKETFGANLYEILDDAFYLGYRSMGSFASKYIQKLIKEITECSSLDRENYNIYKQKIEYIGNALIRNKLEEQLLKKLNETEGRTVAVAEIDQKIQQLELRKKKIMEEISDSTKISEE